MRRQTWGVIITRSLTRWFLFCFNLVSSNIPYIYNVLVIISILIYVSRWQFWWNLIETKQCKLKWNVRQSKTACTDFEMRWKPVFEFSKQCSVFVECVCWILCVKAIRSLFIQYIFIYCFVYILYLKVSERLNERPILRSNDHDHKSLTFMYPLRCACILFTLNLSIQPSDSRCVYSWIINLYKRRSITKSNRIEKSKNRSRLLCLPMTWDPYLKNTMDDNEWWKTILAVKMGLFASWANIWIFEL